MWFFDDKRKRNDDNNDDDSDDNDGDRHKPNDNGTIDVVVDADEEGGYTSELQKDARLRSSFGKAEKHNDAYHMDEDITAL